MDVTYFLNNENVNVLWDVIIDEDIIKRQFNCKATGFWVKKSKESNFLLIMHEHLFIFQKIYQLI